MNKNYRKIVLIAYLAAMLPDNALPMEEYHAMLNPENGEQIFLKKKETKDILQKEFKKLLMRYPNVKTPLKDSDDEDIARDYAKSVLERFITPKKIYEQDLTKEFIAIKNRYLRTIFFDELISYLRDFTKNALPYENHTIIKSAQEDFKALFKTIRHEGLLKSSFRSVYHEITGQFIDHHTKSLQNPLP